MPRQKRFSFGDFLLRWGAAVVLVFATYNPAGFSFLSWLLTTSMSEDLPFKVLAGIVLAVGYIIFLRATMRSIGPVGIALAAGFLAAIIWVAVDFGLLDPSNPTILMWIALFIFAWVMAIGLSWSHVRRRLSGQYDIDDVDE